MPGVRSRPRVPAWLAAMVLTTVLLGVVSAGLPAVTSSPLTTGRGEVRLYLDVLEEGNLPTWWATSVLVLAAAACAAVASLARGGRRHRWRVLAVLVALLSLDEMTALHERLDRLVAGRVDLGSYPFLWVVPGIVLGAVLLAVVVLLVRETAMPARGWLLGGFALVLAAALGGELVQGSLLGAGEVGPWYVLAYHAEEAGETLGAIAVLAGAVHALGVRRGPDGSLTLTGPVSRAGGTARDRAAASA